MNTVPKDVLVAFGMHPSVSLRALPGGSLVCYRAGNSTVFRPSEDDSESQQIAQIMGKLAQVIPGSAQYRISRPIPLAADSTYFVYNGWAAWSFLSGSHRDEPPWDETLRVCCAFHQDIGKIDITKPEFLSRRINRFREADLIAWGEKGLDQVPRVTDPAILSRINGPLAQLETLKRKLSDNLPSQIVHGDIGGNMLFDEDGQPPGIIDLTFYWRPAALGAAIVVADGLMWHGQGEALVKMYGTDADHMQILVRALLFRIVTWAIDIPVTSVESDAIWRDRMMPQVKFSEPVEIIQRLLSS